MRRVVLSVLAVVFLSGCSAAPRAAVCASFRERAPANLVLGPTRDHSAISEAFTTRSAWPSVDSGILFDDVSTYTEIIDDDQSFYTRDGGSFTQEAVSVRSGTLFR